MGELLMPRLSDDMEEGTILRWVKSNGEGVSVGDDLVELETDKATVTYQSPKDGFLHILSAPGETVSVGHPIATLEPKKTTAPKPQPSPSNDATPKVSPLARRVARELGIDLGAVAGSGPGGRIVRSDVETAARGAGRLADELAGAETAPTARRPEVIGTRPNPETPVSDRGDDGQTTDRDGIVVQPLTNAQRVIARRMTQSRSTIPDFAVEIDIDMEAAQALRTRIKDIGNGDAWPPTINDLIIKACALALRHSPRMNGVYRNDRFELNRRVNIGFAVAVPDGLLVPTLPDADRKPLAEIARESRTLTQRARDGVITPREMADGTFTVSNLGMRGIRAFTPIIPTAQAAILGVGRVERRAVEHAGALAARSRMTATLSCDHRIVYGADAADFLERVKLTLEQPLRLLI